MRYLKAALAATALALLAACGGGGSDKTPQEQANDLVTENRVLYRRIQEATVAERAPLVQAFNLNVADFQALGEAARQPQCGTQKGREDAWFACRAEWTLLTTPLT